MTVKKAFLAIPFPVGQAGLMATVIAMRDAVNQLVSLAGEQDPTKPGTFITSGYLTPRLNSLTKTASDANANASSAATNAQTAHQTATSAQGTVAALRDLVNGLLVPAGGIDGNFYNVSAIESVDGSRAYNLEINGSVLLNNSLPGSKLKAGAVDTGNIVTDAISKRASSSSSSTNAAVSLTFDHIADVLVFGSFTGPQVSSPGGTGTIIVTIDGSDTPLTSIPTAGGNALPAMGFLLANNLSAGHHTFSVRAEFTTGPTDLNGVSIMAVALYR
jgi:hypothetical protein